MCKVDIYTRDMVMCGFTGEFVEQNKECYKQKAIDESMELQRRDVKVYRPADIIMELKSLPVLLCIFARNKTETRYPDALTLTLTLKLELLRVCSFSIPTLLLPGVENILFSSLPIASMCLWTFRPPSAGCCVPLSGVASAAVECMCV